MRGAEDVDVERVAEDFGGDGGGGGGGGFGGGGGVGVVRGDGEAEWGGGAGGGGGDFVLEEVGGVVDGGACCWGGAREAGGFELGGEGTSARLGAGWCGVLSWALVSCVYVPLVLGEERSSPAF